MRECALIQLLLLIILWETLVCSADGWQHKAIIFTRNSELYNTNIRCVCECVCSSLFVPFVLEVVSLWMMCKVESHIFSEKIDFHYYNNNEKQSHYSTSQKFKSNKLSWSSVESNGPLSNRISWVDQVLKVMVHYQIEEVELIKCWK